MYAQLKSFLVAGCLLAASTLGVAAFEAVTVEPSELREGPAWEFAPIVGLPPGSIVEVLNCDRRWCEVGIEDYDGFIPRGVLDLGGSPVPFYAFPPLIAAPSLWHGRYYSRDHYRYESRARWRDRNDRRIYVLPQRVQPRPLRPIGPGERRGGQKQFDQKQFQPKQKQFQPDGPGSRRMIEPDRRGSQPKQFEKQGEPQRIQRAPDQPRIQRAPDQPRIQQQQKIQQQAPVQRQAPPPAQKQQEKKKSGER